MDDLLLLVRVSSSLRHLHCCVSLIGSDAKLRLLALEEGDKMVELRIVSIAEARREMVVNAILNLSLLRVDGDSAGAKVLKGNHGLLFVETKTN